MPKQPFFLVFITCCLLLPVGISVAQKPRSSVSSDEVNGVFKMNFKGKFKEFSNEVKILALGRGKIRFAMDLVYPIMLKGGEPTVNMGSLDDIALISGDTAIYESSEFGPCKIIIKFVKPGTIKVDQDGSDADCGFGRNVSAGGVYRKVSNRKPKFED